LLSPSSSDPVNHFPEKYRGKAREAFTILMDAYKSQEVWEQVFDKKGIKCSKRKCLDGFPVMKGQGNAVVVVMVRMVTIMEV